MSNLINLTNQNHESIIANCESNGQILNGNCIVINKRSFNLTDFYYLCHRSMKSSIIRGWRLEFLKAFCLLFGGFLITNFYPNDIGLDASCPIDVLNQYNISKITDKVYDVLNGNRSKAELNIYYLAIFIGYFGLVYVECVTLVFSNEIKVS